MRVRPNLAIILLTALTLITPCLVASSQVSGTVAPDKTWTIMVYMADDYSVTLNWQDDVNEMEAAVQSQGTSIVALVDPYGSGNSQILKVTNDPNFLNGEIVSPVVDDGGAVISGGEVDMASPSTLSSFVQFAAQTYPADMLVLILWGHGASWRGLCPDGSDVLTLPELRTGLSEAVTAIGRTLDMVVVDSCAEASIEMFAQLRGLATVFVGSEKDVPFQGLPYVLVMNDLASNPSQGPVGFGSRIAQDYVTWSTTNSDYSVTMGVFNITKIDPLLASIDALSIAGARYDDLFHQTTRAALGSSEEYEEEFRVDFADMTTRLSAVDLPLELKHSAVQCVIGANDIIEHFSKYSNPFATDDILVPNATGFTIYAPSNLPIDASYFSLEIANSSWADFGVALRNDTITIENGPGPSVTFGASVLYDIEAYDVPPIDAATLAWPEIYDEVQAVVYRQAAEGLVFVKTLDSVGSTIEFRTPGRLTVAASAEIDGQAVSYEVLNFTLQGSATIGVRLLEDGSVVQDIIDRFTIVVVTQNGTQVTGGFENLTVTDTCLFRLKIPEVVEIGDTVTIEVRDASSEDLVGSTISSVPSELSTVQVPIWKETSDQSLNLVPILFVALPGLLLLVFAMLMYRQQKGKR